MRVFLIFCVSCSLKALATASGCGRFAAGVCKEEVTSSLNASVVYTRTFPKCCKPDKEDMTFREGVRCLKEDSNFLHSFVQCIKAYFEENKDYNALKPADAMAKIGPDTIRYVLTKKPGLKRFFDRASPLEGTNRTYWEPFDGDKWLDPGDALAGFGQQQFFRFAVGAMPHGSSGQGVQYGRDGNAPPRNRLNTYQKEGAKYNYTAVTFWAGAGNGFSDILTVPTFTEQAANIGFFVRYHHVETIAELFKVVGEAGTNLFEKGMHMKAMHTDGQDVPLLHVRLDMEQKKGVLWPASRHLTAEHEAKMICIAFQSQLNAPWTLKQLNAAWAKDLQPNLAHLTFTRSNFYDGFEKDNATNGPLTQLLAGKWDGHCSTAAATTSDWTLPIIAIVCAVMVMVAIVMLMKSRSSVRTTRGREPLLNC